MICYIHRNYSHCCICCILVCKNQGTDIVQVWTTRSSVVNSTDFVTSFEAAYCAAWTVAEIATVEFEDGAVKTGYPDHNSTVLVD